MTKRIKYLLITGLFMLVSSGAMAGAIVGSITFTTDSFTGPGEVTVGTDDFSGLVGDPVVFANPLSPFFNWSVGGFTFIVDFDSFSLDVGDGVFAGNGNLMKGGDTTFALLSGFFDQDGFTATTTAVPEPQTLALLGIALLAFGTIRLSRSRNRH